MLDSDTLKRTMERYLERVAAVDAEGVLALFAADISVEDPVGGPPGTHVVGLDAVRPFFTKGFARSRPSPERTGPIRTTGSNQAAMPFRLRLTIRGRRMEVDVIDTMTFDEERRITSLRAFWSPEDMREVEEPS